jgi:cytochrome c oxidase accessory protein FixG
MSTDTSEKATPFYKKRYIFYVFMTILSLVMPFITIGGNHIFLLSFENARLELLGTAFDMQEFYLLPFLLMLLFLFVFFITVVGGRVWCGWACPQTIFRTIYRDLIQGKLLKMNSRKNKQKEKKMSDGERRAKNLIAMLIWSLLAVIASADLIWYFVPPETFFEYMKDPAEHTIVFGSVAIMALFLIYDVVKLKEDFCSYICPYVRIQSVLYEDETIMAMYDTNRGGIIYDEEQKKVDEVDECTKCESCVTVCPTHIDIRKGLQLECINCLECVDACTTVMGKLGKESLVRWESPVSMKTGKINFVRTKSIMYVVLLVGITIALFMMGANKEHMLLNINKSNRVYKIEPNHKVSNDYIFLFTNTQSEAYTYSFEIEGHDDIIIERPKAAFKINAGGKVKKIVKLSTNKIIVQDSKVTTKIPLIINAFAVDAKEKIFVKRQAIFAYPPTNEVK